MAFSKKLSAVGPDSPTDIVTCSVSKRIEVWETRGEDFWYRSGPENDWLLFRGGKSLVFAASHTPGQNLGQLRTMAMTTDFYQFES